MVGRGPYRATLVGISMKARALASQLAARASRSSKAERIAAAGLVAWLFLAALATLKLFVFVPCSGDEPCVTVGDLLDGAPLPEALHLYDRHGVRYANVAGPLRTTLPGDRVPDGVARAFVAVEDRRFWDHGGVDTRGVVRAALRNLLSADIEEGASTIPMQLVRSVWAEPLREVGPWRRKLFEATVAPRLVRRLGHERVLTLYLDAIYLGNGIYGVEEASRFYFGVPPDSLDLARTATLVGMARSPEHLDPRRHPEAARARRAVVLDLLVAEGLATREEALQAESAPLGTSPEPRRSDRRGYVTAAVTRELRRVAPELAGRAGLHIFTTLDSVAQAEGEAAVLRRLEHVEEGVRAPRDRPLQGAAVALDPSSGEILAWIGGRDFQGSEFDRVELARRQVGSLVKPFVVAAALVDGRGILDLVSSDTLSLASPDGPWSPADHVDQIVLPVREALVRSSNRAAVRLGRAVGVVAVRAVGRQAGIVAPIPDLPSTLIGSFEASLLEMTAAYATFGNGGIRVEPHLVRRIEDRDGSVLWERPSTPEMHALDPVTSFSVLDALADVVDRGTGWPVRAAGYWGPAAGKTGTTDDGRDAWFVGLVPDLVAGIWIGYDEPAPITTGASGGSLAAPAWAEWMTAVDEARGGPRGRWAAPEGVVEVRYDPASGEVFDAGCEARPGGRLVSAWVGEGSYRAGSCRGPVIRWLDGLWSLLRGGPDPETDRDTIR